MLYKGKLYYPTFHTTNAPIARKGWKCSLCGEPVQTGERYVRYTWRKETEIDDLPYHPECWAIIRFYCKMTGETMFSAEAVHAWLKTRRHCKTCKEAECHMSRCEKLKKWVKFKPIQTAYDRMKPMDEKYDKSLFEIIDG